MNHRIFAATATVAVAAVLCSAENARAHATVAAPIATSAKVRTSAGVLQEGAFFRTRTVTVVRNFPDQNGSVFGQVPAGTIVRAYGTSQGKPPFREVEIAGGFPVWVFGQFLQPTEVDGVLLVTGSRVNMRPSPEVAPSAMPLRSKLDAGQRVRLIERANRASAFGQDWIRVQAPATVRAWIVADAVTPIDATTGAAEWAKANPALPTRPTRTANSAGTRSAAPKTTQKAAGPVVTAELLARLAEADAAFDAASALRSPTAEAWRDVVVAYEAVVEEAPPGSITRQNASSRLHTAEAQMELASLREEVNDQARRHEAELDKVNEYLENKRAKSTANWGRFQGRGWVDARRIAGTRRHYLVFGGKTVAEIQCSNERFDLSIFEGFEIGVMGDEVAAAVRGTSMSPARARIVDVARIEVISGSSIRR